MIAWRAAAMVVAGAFAAACGSDGPSAEGDAHLSLGDTLWVRGALEGPSAEVFGGIDRIAFNADSWLAVLDAVTPSLEVFTRDGRLIGSVGTEGDGPGEWRWPADISWIEPDTVVVLNSGHRRLTTYHASEGGLVLVGEVTLAEPRSPRALCVLGDRIFVAGYQDGSLVREVARDGRVLSSFGEPAPAPEGISERWLLNIRGHSASGRLLCDASNQLVVVVPLIIPFVQAFRPDGALAWQRELLDYRRTRFVMVLDGRGLQLSPDPETGTVHQLESAFSWGDQIAVQIGEYDLSGEEPDRVQTRWLDGRTGSALLQQEDLPRIGAIGHGTAALFSERPFPHMAVGRIEPSGDDR